MEEVEEMVEGSKGCNECESVRMSSMEEECADCGEGIRQEQGEFAMVGMDAVALFPSLSGRNTARIVRRRVEESKVEWRGFNWKKATIYIMANKNLVEGIDKDVRKYFPIRKSNRGVTPGMTSEGMNNKELSEEKQSYFYRKPP